MRKRAKHTLSHYRLLTSEMGQLVPIGCVPVLPGDTFQHHTSALVRVSPLNTPVMHPVQVRIHHFFVPNRIIWPETSETIGWERFITGGPNGTDVEPPPTRGNSSNRSILEYLGVPRGSSQIQVNVLPVRAFNKVYNEYYRDQDIVPERGEDLISIPRISWEKDYFTTARPWTQKGPDVTVPIGETAPVIGTGASPTWESMSGDDRGFTQHDTAGGDDLGLTVSNPDTNTLEEVRWNNPALVANLASATGVSVNDFREAFAIQRYQEARARYGSRFTEYLRYLGITPSDARLQRPEYLGGGTARLNFSEVLQTTPSTQGDAGVGDLYGHGIAGAKTNRYRKFFEEHGYVLSVMSVRPKSVYVNGAPREFWKQSKEDYFQKELVHLGQQPIDNRELSISADGSTFGYQDRYDEYRQQWSQICGDFTSTLDSWHLGRFLPNTVALNPDFIDCDPDDRIYQVTEGDKLWIMVNHHITARRLVPKKARPRIL